MKQQLKKEWKDNAFNAPDDPHTVLDIEWKEDNRIEIRSEYLILHIGFSANSRLMLEDLSEPEPKRSIIDVGRSFFQGLEEINKLRTAHNDSIYPTENKLSHV